MKNERPGGIAFDLIGQCNAGRTVPRERHLESESMGEEESDAR